ncbi:MAG: EAL domain-containing protein [Proteobacteria bacterium]|nr:EAL domain-containing protein [Pseudomonadota bacterium]
MRGGIFRKVRTYLVATAIVCVATALVATIFFTQDNLPWIAFLTGILAASVLAEAARATRSEWVLMRRTAQLAAMKEKFELESGLRKQAEKKIAEDSLRLRLIDETLATMIVLIDSEGHCRYHNRAFREWLHLKAELIDGRHIRELFGSKAYAGIATSVQQSLDGQPLRYEYLQEMSGGAVYRLSVEQVPLYNAAGKTNGFYFLADDITLRGDLPVAGKTESKLPADSVSRGLADQEMFLDVFSEQFSGRADVGKQFIGAIQRGEFHLYCQLISPLPIASGTAHYEILIRLVEEEGSMIPPGAFFPLAEKNGLMPYLDRWVVGHVLEWAANQPSRDSDSLFFINVAAATIGDPEFPDFLQSTLDEFGVPGSSLCFEVSEADLLIRNSSVAEFIRRVRQCGCRVALSGFGRNTVSFDQIRGFQVEFLKIDGSAILNMLSNPVDLAKVVSIDRVAKKIGVKTVAELVESDEIVAKLGEIGIDYAQGFGISRPRRLGE